MDVQSVALVLSGVSCRWNDESSPCLVRRARGPCVRAFVYRALWWACVGSVVCVSTGRGTASSRPAQGESLEFCSSFCFCSLPLPKRETVQTARFAQFRPRSVSCCPLCVGLQALPSWGCTLPLQRHFGGVGGNADGGLSFCHFCGIHKCCARESRPGDPCCSVLRTTASCSGEYLSAAVDFS